MVRPVLRFKNVELILNKFQDNVGIHIYVDMFFCVFRALSALAHMYIYAYTARYGGYHSLN